MLVIASWRVKRKGRRAMRESLARTFKLDLCGLKQCGKCSRKKLFSRCAERSAENWDWDAKSRRPLNVSAAADLGETQARALMAYRHGGAANRVLKAGWPIPSRNLFDIPSSLTDSNLSNAAKTVSFRAAFL